ncbi:Dynamin central region-containing protein 4 [Elsinoe fawcettii]|nr:Dynamin central region-containing protein 4 [Elsinoe fawcettii]
MAISAQEVTNGSLETLQTDDARNVMDTVDRLRKAGLGSIVQLPQIVTVGDQSSGKSSTLEAITGIPFPRKENLCTRFATQIVMRRAATETVSVTIIPDKLRPVQEQQRLRAISLKLESFDKLGELMETATDALGLNTSTQLQVRAFSRDVLNIEVSGPSRPQLTLVDLPGLIHSETKQQSREDVKLITELVENYIKEKRTIVLAVVSARNDYANQIVLKKARDLNAADRTLGIVTKTDVLEPGVENETTWIHLAQNKDVVFGLGWHMLRNRTPKEMEESLEYRDQAERDFFSHGNYPFLDADMLGVETLRARLSKLLFEHLTKELPLLLKELKQKHDDTNRALRQLGHARVTTDDQRQYLMLVGQDFEKVATSAVAAHYELSVLSNIDHNVSAMHKNNVIRLRAAIQYADLQIATQMRQYGSKFKVVDGHDELMAMGEKEDKSFSFAKYYKDAEAFQLVQSHSEAVKWVQNILERTRGRELPGNFNPAIIGQLFREQSSPWAQLATDHIDQVMILCKHFVELVLKSVTTDDVFSKVFSNIVEPALQSRSERAHAELARILEDKNGDPITYNHYYVTTIQNMRTKKQERKVQELVKKNSSNYRDNQIIVDTKTLSQALMETSVEQDMDKFSAEDALVCHMAYYIDELHNFVNCVTKHVIERHLIRDISSGIISSVKFGLLDADELRRFAAEPNYSMKRRENLSERKEMLENGMKQFRFVAGSS